MEDAVTPIPAEAELAAAPEKRWKLPLINRLALGGLQLALGLSAGSMLATNGGCTDAELGGQPVRICAEVDPTDWNGGSYGDLAPVFAIDVPDSHRGPVHLTVKAKPLDTTAPELQNLTRDPASIEKVAQAFKHDVLKDLEPAVQSVLLQSGLLFMAGNAAVWSMKPVYDFLSQRPGAKASSGPNGFLRGAAIGLAALLPTGYYMYDTRQPDAITTARIYGPAKDLASLAGNVEGLLGRYDEFSKQLANKAVYGAELYETARNLEVVPRENTLRVLYWNNLHCNIGMYKALQAVAKTADIDLAIAGGGATDYGSEAENACLDPMNKFVDDRGRPLRVLYVKDNHDSSQSVRYIDEKLPNVTVLKGKVVEEQGVRFIGDSDPRYSPDPAQDESITSPELDMFYWSLLQKAEAGGAQVVVAHEGSVAEKIAANHRGKVGTVLGTSTYVRRVKVVNNTNLHIEGTAGANGARALEGDRVAPVMFSILNIDKATGRVLGADLINIDAFGSDAPQLNVTSLDRTLVYQRPRPTTSTSSTSTTATTAP